MDDSSKPQSAKQLKELLQHQQEPFSLQDYLTERSFMFKNCNSGSSSIHSLYSAKNLKWSIKNDVHKIRRRFLHVTEILRSLLYKFTPIVDNHEFSSCDEHNSDRYYVHEIAEDIRETQQVNEPFSLRRFNLSHHFANSDVVDKVFPYENDSSTLVNMSFTLPNLRRSEVDTCTKPRWISSKENWQQCKRGSKWKDQPSAVCHLGSTEFPVTPLQTLSQKLVRDPAFSTYLRKLLVNSNILTFKHARRVQQKKNQLHCVEKDRGFHKNEGRNLSFKAVSESSKDIQNIIHERFSFLEKQYKGVEKITHLVHAESSVISEEWTSLHIMNWEIHMEIGDSIMDDIVKEIIDLF
ncbi:uncharacterized protein LOC130735684 [Lotus japonicus]|uniref:uncharacterized protein LOC130735684 n=1 Tax=Lotus japonicus TaxID=34305 RepID=UPI0025850EDB|nr:uncharacterized protein LOC130735684 [Lotus japonicus]